jgi:succinate dehydrogenase/fumarate reductase flavoprotein subunit
MAGLCAAVRAVELGTRTVVLEKGTRAGGSMALSSGVVWRHRSFDEFRRECQGGDPALQRLVWERLDSALAWLIGRGAPVVSRETGNPLTTGVRYDPPGLVATLLNALPAGALRLGTELASTEGRVVLATGGFAASPELVARWIAPAARLRLRGNPGSTGGGLEHALARGAALTPGMDGFYGRAMPDAPWDERDFVPAAQVYARHARIFDEEGEEFFRAEDVSWSETNVAQATARREGARAYYLVAKDALDRRVRDRTVRELVDAAPAAARVPVEELPFAAPPGTVAAVRVVAAITHTIGGLRIDTHARVLDGAGIPIPGLWAAGVDVGGVSTGGYASGLAQALVLGLVAAESAMSVQNKTPYEGPYPAR